MAYRVITDDVPVSTSLNQLSHLGERLHWRLLSQTDTWGRLPGELVKIRDLCVPRLAVSDNELAGALEELVRAGRIAIYCVDGTWVCQLLDFDRHQPIARLKRAPSRWPAPPTDRQTTPVEKAWEHDSDTARHGNGAPKTPAKSLISKDRREKTEETRLTGSPTAVPQYAELPISQPEEHAEAAPDERLRFGKWNLADVARTLRGADAGTAYALASVLRGLPEGAMARALEGLDSRRRRQPPIQHEAKWLVSTIVQMRQEGQFS